VFGITRSGTGMGAYLNPFVSIGFLTGIIFLRGHGMGLLYPPTYPLPSLVDNMKMVVDRSHRVLQDLWLWRRHNAGAVHRLYDTFFM